jgi:multidrug transporter EmrE-like cation transporter
MNPWLSLLPATLIFIIGSLFSFSDTLRNSKWYTPVFVILGIAMTFLWIWATKVFDDKNKIYVFSLVWDFLMMAAYYLLPFCLYKFKFSWPMIIGALLMVAGVVVVKIYGEE